MADRFVQEVAQAAKTWDELRAKDKRAHDPSVLRKGIERIRRGSFDRDHPQTALLSIEYLCTKLLAGEEIE